MAKRLVLVLAAFLLASGALLWNARPGGEGAHRRAGSSISRGSESARPPASGSTAGAGERDGREPGASGLHGRVLDATTGAGVPGAELAVFDYVEGTVRRVGTDADGRFSLSAEPGRAYRVIVRGPHGDSQMLRRVAPSSAPLSIQLASAAALSGSVVDPDGRPVPDARLALVRPLPRKPQLDVLAALFEQAVPDELLAEARAAAPDGRFAFDRIGPGPVALLVDAPGFAPGLHELDEPLAAGETRAIVVPVARLGPVRVRVVDADAGEPVRGVRFLRELGRGRQAYRMGPADAREIEAGLYELDVALRADGQLGTTQLRIERAGFVPGSLDFSGFSIGHTFRVVMGPGAHVTGTVTIPDAAVVLLCRDVDERVLARVPIDAGGRFEAGPIPVDGEIEVHVYDAGVRRALGYAAVRLRHGETRDLRFGADDRPAILGSLRIDGKPASLALLALSGPGRRNREFAGDDGRFRFDGLEPGRYELFANLAYDREIFVTRTVELGSEPVELDLDARFVIEGRVVSAATGEPIRGSGADVEARLLGQGPSADKDATRLRDDGTFTLRVTRPGTWELDVPSLFVDEKPTVAVPADGRPVHAEIAARDDPEDRVVRVRILDDATGDAVASGDFDFSSAGAVWISGGGGFEAGEATIEGLPRGPCTIRIESPLHVTSVIEVTFAGETRALERTARLRRANAIVVTAVADGGAAKQAGMRVGDVLLRYGSQRVNNLGELKQAIEAASGTIAVELRREGKPLALSLPAGRMGIEAANGRIED